MDEFNKLFHKLEKADVRFNMIVKMSNRISDLEAYILEQGKKNNVCTYHILNKKVCPDCKCGKNERT
jgi:uncharacterized protein YutD